jgi:Flp pilus assembly protein TadG
LIEFALVAPLLLTLLLGIVDFGTTFENMQVLRQGVRDAAREGTVANYGPPASCTLTFGAGSTNPGAGDVENLMCLTKSNVGVVATSAASVRIMVAFAPAGLDGPNLTGANQAAVGNGLVVCAQYALTSITGFFTSFLTGKVARSKTVMRIEQPPGGTNDTMGAESPPPGGDWSWCNATTSSP